ncbi:IS110 family transposase [Pseudarthrobacter sp. NIBRBAC000502772]|nr:IS110 family transposase [Pseudarthrobacter sp. NIBRBAC000502772]
MSFPAPGSGASYIRKSSPVTIPSCLHGPTMEQSVPVYAGVSLVPSSPQMSLVLEDFHGFRGLLLRARASDSKFALSSPEQHQGLRRRGSLQPSLLAKEKDMEVLHYRCSGMDISKRDAKVCVRVPGARQNTFTKVITVTGATTHDILELRDDLVAEEVTLVVMEATSDYWKPFYYLLDPVLNVILVNARHARNLPGRKTDVSDAQWLAELGAHGLVRASFVREHIRQLRDLTRSRTIFVAETSREIQRVEKLLEDANIKISSVATRTLGVSGRAMLEALIAGARDPLLLADLARGRLKNRTAHSSLKPSMAGSTTATPTQHRYTWTISIRSTSGSSASATASIIDERLGGGDNDGAT